ncbi:MAG: hypothetical protein H6973_13505 [Gammaproteobacteria bacterium]|nr:hypothetical protein [Gammaproteobacteria bacterium]
MLKQSLAQCCQRSVQWLRRIHAYSLQVRHLPAPVEPVTEEQHLMPYDEHLLERSRTQWQLGDWASLCQLNPGALQHHPDQAKLALLAAAGHLQMGEPAAARQWIRQAMEWGGDQRLMNRILIAGVHNSLGRAATVAGKSNQALHHFRQALATGIPGSEVRLLAPTRARLQAMQLGLAGAVPFLENLESASTVVTRKIEQQLQKMQTTLEKKQADSANALTQIEALIKDSHTE